MESTKQGRHTRDIENLWRYSQPDGEAGTPLEQDRDEFGDRGEGRSQGVSPIPQGDTAVPLVFANSNNSDLPHRGGRKQNRCGWLIDHLAEQVTGNSFFPAVWISEDGPPLLGGRRGEKRERHRQD